MPTRVIGNVARRSHRSAAFLIGAVAAVVVLAFAGFAVARSFTLQTHKQATVKTAKHTTKHETIVTNAKGFAVYWLTGDKPSHPKCTKTNGCFSIWPPVTAASAASLSKAPGIKGKLTTMSRNGIVQAVLGGHPLYTYSLDTKKGVATGEGVATFGGTWHVALPAGAVQGNQGLPQGY